MNIKSFSKIAAVSAIAMMAAMHATGVVAAPVQIGDLIAVNFNAEVENTIDVVVTDGEFGVIGAMNHTTSTASLVLPPSAAPVLVPDGGTGFLTAGQAAIVPDPTSATPATGAEVVVTAAFDTTDLYVTFDGCNDVTDGTDTFLLSAITTSLDATTYDCVTPMATGSVGTTDGGGALTFYVGATITTDQSDDAAYGDSAAYTGSVDMYISY